MPACGEWAWYNREKGIVSTFFCGSGKCHRPECTKLFWSRRVALLSDLIETHTLDKFFTLTLDRGNIGPNIEPWEYIHHPWSKMRKRMNRRHEDFLFVAILEEHKDSRYPHIHGFTNIWMKQAEWSDMWEGCRGGKIVDVRKVDTVSVGEYVSKQLEVAKYVGKENLRRAYLQRHGKRTLWRSKGLKGKKELQKSKEWSILKEGVYREDGTMREFWEKQFEGEKQYAKKKQCGQDMEAARCSVPVESTEASCQDMEAKIAEDE